MLRIKVALALLTLAALLSLALPLAALSCYWPDAYEAWELELVSVSVDGESAPLPARYDDITLTLNSEYEGVTFNYVSGNPDIDRQALYRSEPMPEAYLPFVADQGER
ncbi:hypothetical protein DL240_11635 [Lujinxingia litoralis]|uniref:Uncharacterized protein n=1 Tax=Lujinxingia litoralis TaxID=2211119 RepID=A0A328C5M7_9DELT|nr:hypothetical protein [Lujinxingia litoralis]RAL21507.1 hypothetical protein DL240_11635 [Lujinxingia litoralis]